MKLVYSLNSICTRGGIEMVTLTKANALADMPDNEVYLVVTDHRSSPMIPLHPRIKLINLKVDYYADDWKSRWHVFYGFFVKRFIHKRKLARALHQIQPDIVVSVGTSEKNMIPSIRGNWKCIREFHYVRSYRKLQSKTVVDKIMAYGGDIMDYFILPRYDKVVVLTEEDRFVHWRNCRNVVVIPNPIRSSFEGVSPLIHKKVITAGRLTAQKNHHSLIKAFSRVVKNHPDWTLDICGEGPLKEMLEQEIIQLDLEDHVHLCGFTSNLPSSYVESSMFVLSSIYEGFALVAIEAMSSGLPLVSYACPCGPRDIIMDGKDGFLIPMNDEKQLADRICYLIEHEEERKQMGQAALEKSKQYSLDKIMARWQDLFNTLVNERC